ncbi:zinc finger protein [Theobroma cacao]|nr:zinc finger protein [Theobroma cacao]
MPCHGLPTPNQTATCPMCSFGRAYFIKRQIRSADKPATIFYRCVIRIGVRSVGILPLQLPRKIWAVVTVKAESSVSCPRGEKGISIKSKDTSNPKSRLKCIYSTHINHNTCT